MLFNGSILNTLLERAEAIVSAPRQIGSQAASVAYNRMWAMLLDPLTTYDVQTFKRGAVGALHAATIDTEKKRGLTRRPLLNATNYKCEAAEHVELRKNARCLNQKFDRFLGQSCMSSMHTWAPHVNWRKLRNP